MSKIYRVNWEIDIDAESPNDAANKAREIQLDPDSLATCFYVREYSDKDGVVSGERVIVDTNTL